MNRGVIISARYIDWHRIYCGNSLLLITFLLYISVNCIVILNESDHICVYDPGDSSSKTTLMSMPSCAHLARTSSRSWRQWFSSREFIVRLVMRLMRGVQGLQSSSRCRTISKSWFWLYHGFDTSSEKSQWRQSSYNVSGKRLPTSSATSGSNPSSKVIGTSTEECLEICFRNPLNSSLR